MPISLEIGLGSNSRVQSEKLKPERKCIFKKKGLISVLKSEDETQHSHYCSTINQMLRKGVD